ncbi:hypothetical protein DPEC_G00211030 [Dallia pectoralis]|uniref:Uncharacterized protein n=1 Tax=Dallia pectoralis TaxID=75939 RepID=A0ACC2G632_DALPE|nr:hypothetical protein DPEC_G00211030 [Dallia pectoralis]
MKYFPDYRWGRLGRSLVPSLKDTTVDGIDRTFLSCRHRRDRSMDHKGQRTEEPCSHGRWTSPRRLCTEHTEHQPASTPDVVELDSMVLMHAGISPEDDKRCDREVHRADITRTGK